MSCQGNSSADIVTEDEAWALFKTAAHLQVEDDSSNVAKMVSRECARLPVAIMSVGKTLRGKHPREWERALKKLQDCEHQNIRDNAYKNLEFCFHELPREETKRCLLLCSLYPQDYEICVEDLARYAHGLGLYRNAQSIKDTLGEVIKAVDELKDSHFLLEAETAGHVTMHNLVRDVVLLIGKSYTVITESKTEKEFNLGGGVGLEQWPTDESLRDYAALSLWDIQTGQFPDRLDCPRLEMLLLPRRKARGRSLQQYTHIPDKSFERLGKLEVLSISYGILSAQSLESLKNLRTLELRHCKFTSGENATDLASLRNLKRLEILSFYGSDIDELPDEIGELRNLKLLELTNCYSLISIPPNLVRKLSKLEELHIGVFEDWEVEEKGACVVELNSLQNLDILTFASRGHMPQNFAFSKLSGYHLHMCDCEYPDFLPRLRYPTLRTICFVATEATVTQCKELFMNVIDLSVVWNDSKCVKNMMPDMSAMGFEDLGHLYIYGCEMDCLISTSKLQRVALKAFSNLVKLKIAFTTLRELCEGPPPEQFLEKLQTLTIDVCDQMITIFPVKLMHGIQNLVRVKIRECENVQEIFQLEGLDESNKECLSHLTRMELNYLDALTCIWKGHKHSHLLNLKSLTQLKVHDCRSLKYLLLKPLAQSMVSLEELDIRGCNQLEHIIAEMNDIDEGDTVPYLQNLKSIKIEQCNSLKYVFPVAQGFQHLTKLYVKECDQLTAMFGNEDQADRSNMVEVAFPNLLDLSMEKLPILIRFCPRGYLFQLPSLQRLRVKSCPEMTTSFSAASDTCVHAIATTTEAPTLGQDTTRELVPLSGSTAMDSEWTLVEGKWIAELDEEEEKEKKRRRNSPEHVR